VFREWLLGEAAEYCEGASYCAVMPARDGAAAA